MNELLWNENGNGSNNGEKGLFTVLIKKLKIKSVTFILGYKETFNLLLIFPLIYSLKSQKHKMFISKLFISRCRDFCQFAILYLRLKFIVFSS